MFKGTTKIIYDPYRGDMKRDTDWWCIADVDDEICRYYRWWVWNRYMITLQKPSWGGHISIVRGEHIRNKFKPLWKSRAGKTVNFEYSHDVTTKDGVFWYIDVVCLEFNQIRKELGLDWHYADGGIFHFHVTVGRTQFSPLNTSLINK